MLRDIDAGAWNDLCSRWAHPEGRIVTSNRSATRDPEDAAARIRDLIDKRRRGVATREERIDLARHETMGLARGAEFTRELALKASKKVAEAAEIGEAKLSRIDCLWPKPGPIAYRVSFIYPSERIAHRVMSPGGEAHAIKEPCVGTFKVVLIHDREVGVYSVAAYGATS